MKNKLLIILGFTIICHSFELSMALPHSADIGAQPCPSETIQTAPKTSKVTLNNHRIGGHYVNVAEAVAAARLDCLKELENQSRIDNQISAFSCKQEVWPKRCSKEYSTQLQEDTDALATTSESCEFDDNGIFPGFWLCNATCETTTTLEFKLRCYLNNQAIDSSTEIEREPLLR